MKTSKILSLIQEANLEEAFESFQQFFDSVKELQKQIIQINSQYNRIVIEDRKGIARGENVDLEKNKITNSLIGILSKLETALEVDVKEAKKSFQKNLSKSDQLRQKANDAIKDKGYEIVEEIYSELSYIFYKAKENDFNNNNFYVVQLLNKYQLIDATMPYDEKLKDFFTKCDAPFVEIQTYETGNPCYSIRDYVDGIDLNNLIENKIKLSLLDTIKSSITIAEGLKELHRKDIVYSNFIPSQIIMDIEGDAKVLPMNIFKTNREVVTWRQLKNSVKYMSPEQLIHTGGTNFEKFLDPLCNQYSLGQIIFFMINGESIFEGKGLVELYEDRTDNKDTISQLRTFIDTINEKLQYYSIPKEEKEEMGSKFIEAFNQLIKFDPQKRFNNIGKFILQMKSLENQLAMTKMDSGDDDLNLVQESFENSVSNNNKIIDDFYAQLLEEIALRNSLELKERNILFYYSMKYLFNSISNLDHTEGLTHALTCLVQSLHSDVGIEDFEKFFEVLKKVIEENNPDDWNEGYREAWDNFNQKVLDAIDVILTTNLPK